MASTGLLDGARGDRVGSPVIPLDAGLMPLAPNAGPTPTHAFRFTSLALDRSDAAAPSTDQRGQPRGQDGNNDGIANSDIGAYEAATLAPPSHIYVDDNWAALAVGVDPDGPATLVGYDAFARIQPALDRVGVHGLVSVAAGNYAETLDVTRDIALEGAGAGQTVLHGNSNGRPLTVNAGTTSVTVVGVTIRDGFAIHRGGVLNEGTLLLSKVIIRDNFAQDGGGIANVGNLTISNSTIHSNRALADGGGIWNPGNLRVENSTISGNQASGMGGGIANGGLELAGEQAFSGQATVNHSTITANLAPIGSGVLQIFSYLKVRSSIIAGNTDLFGAPNLDLDAVSSEGHNLFGRATVNLDFQPGSGDQIGSLGKPLDARLGPLAENGGPTPTHALLPHSPAIDKGDAFNASVYDQRGQRRVEDGDGDRVKVIDIGAFEALSAAITIVPFSGRVKKVGQDSDDSAAHQDPDMLLSQSFPNPHLYQAQILFGIPDPLIGKVMFEARRAGVVLNLQELVPNPGGGVFVSYDNAQPGIDEIGVWATLGEFQTYDSDLVFWNPNGGTPQASLEKDMGHRGYAPTLTTQTFSAGLYDSGGHALMGDEFKFHLFNNDTNDYSFPNNVMEKPNGTFQLSQMRSRPAVEELVADFTTNGQHFFDNVPIKWVLAPPQLTLTTSRPNPTTIRVVASLTRDLDPTLDDTLNPPVQSLPLQVAVFNGGSVVNYSYPPSANPAPPKTNELGQLTFEFIDQSAFPYQIFVEGELVTHLEGDYPNETLKPTHFSAFEVVNDTVVASILPEFIYQELPTRAVLIEGAPFGASAPARANIDVKVLYNTFPTPGIRVDFTINSGPNSGGHHSAVTGTDGIAHMSFLNQNEFDFQHGDGHPGIDVVSVQVGDAVSIGTAKVHWYPSRVTGPQSFAAELLTPVGWLGIHPPWVHVDMVGDPSNQPNPNNPSGPVKVRVFDPLLIDGGLTSFHEITGDNLPVAPQGFSAGDPKSDKKARYYDIHSDVHGSLGLPMLVFINKDDFPTGSDKIFHAEDGHWHELDTFDGAYIAALDAFVDFVFKLSPNLVSDLINAVVAVEQYYTSELHNYWVAVTNSFSPFAIFLPDHAPVDIVMAGNTVAENSANNVVVGGLVATDPDAGDTFTFTLANNAGGRFAIRGTNLVVANGLLLDFETNASHQISVQVVDSSGNVYTKGFTIFVNNVFELQGFDVQKGAAQRSFIRNVDFVFDDAVALQNLLRAGRMQLTRSNLDGLNPTAVNLTGKVAQSARVLSVDFGAQGIGGNRNSNMGDGYYQFKLDMDGDGSFETTRSFYRLFGDTNGDRKVDDLDVLAINTVMGRLGSNLDQDINGDGIVNALDRAYAITAKGRRLLNGLWIDD